MMFEFCTNLLHILLCISHLTFHLYQQQWWQPNSKSESNSNTNLLALRGSETTTSSHSRQLQQNYAGNANYGGNANFQIPNFGNVADNFPNIPTFGTGTLGGGSQPISYSNSYTNISGGGTGVGGGAGFTQVGDETDYSISGNVTTNEAGTIFYLPGTNFTIGEGFFREFQVNWQQRRWRKQRRKQWQPQSQNEV
jgi:hypothetical protein